MRLTTDNGELEIPQNFTITLVKTNPLLSEEGDTTYPVTLPSSKRNLAVVGHRERIDHADPIPHSIDAVLEHGSMERHGKLIFDSANRRAGIDAVFAFDNSDLYVTSKKKTLKEIMASYNNGAGYKQTFQSVAAAASELQHIYGGDQLVEDYVIFPVAVAAYDDNDGNRQYQYNNEIDKTTGQLIYTKRSVHEGSELVSVPEGYGIAPFLLLHRMIDILFECMDITVIRNQFAESPWNKIAVIHNCADALVLPVLQYKDLVPSCTLSEFLEWIEAKFHAYVLVDSNRKEAKILFAEETLKTDPDMDITGFVEGDFTVRRSPSRHVVIHPNTSIEGSQPITETRTALEEQYPYVIELTEADFALLQQNPNPPFYSYLVLRLNTGMYYEQCLDLQDRKAVLREAGTNYFAFDNANAEEEESYSPSDVMPLMICDNKCFTAPYIGDRIHFHTSYNNKEEKGTQDIIIAQYYTSSATRYKTTGTTQQKLAATDGSLISLPFGLTPENLVSAFWGNYNEILLNNETTVEARLALGWLNFNNFNMGTPKLLNGQPLLPRKLEQKLGKRMSLAEGEFILIKEFENGKRDRFTWNHNQTYPETTWYFDLQSDLDAAANAIWPANMYVEVTLANFHQRLIYVFPPPGRDERRTIYAIADITARVTDQGNNTSFRTAENQTIAINLIGR